MSKDFRHVILKNLLKHIEHLENDLKDSLDILEHLKHELDIE